MTAREKLLQLAPNWSEEHAERALRAAESDRVVDCWGDLSKLHEVSSAETMRRLAEEERAAGHDVASLPKGYLGDLIATLGSERLAEVCRALGISCIYGFS